MKSLFIRRLSIGVGVLLIASAIWFAGPYFAFADARPMESPRGRLTAMAVIAALWASIVAARRVRARRASQKLMAAVVEQSQAEPSSPDVRQLRERFEEGIAVLRQRRQGMRSLYDLPWYVIIGAPGSGKTTALLHSNLKFPLEQHVGAAALRGIGGTRHCEWLFTDDAVFLDTAGRYTTQDSDSAADQNGWLEFLALLRMHRPRRPINGVIFAVSADDLLDSGRAVLDTHAAAARRRLQELNRELGIALPVYLMVTKCDLVAGFAEYFAELSAEEREQVWGVTFSYEETVSGAATRLLSAEMDRLSERLNAGLLARMDGDRNVRRRTRLFAFPQQIAAMGRAVTAFAAEAFNTTRFDRPVLLRGVYFTSATQEGTPVDRLLGAMTRTFALASEAIAPPAGRGKTYFVERLLREVILAEAGIAGVNGRQEARKAAVQLGAYAAVSTVAVLTVSMLTVSYRQNAEFLGRVSTTTARLADTPRGQAPETLIPRLDAVRTIVDATDASEHPWSMRWGLYQGRSLGHAAEDAYRRELDSTLLPEITARIKHRLTRYAAEPEKLYEYLKAYLMLGQPEHLDVAQLRFIADLEWQSLEGEDGDLARALSKHFHALLDSGDRLRPARLDEALVAQARSTIRKASLPALIYRQLRLSYAADSGRSLRLDIAAGIGAERVLRRKSGIPLSAALPSLYTRAVFKEITGRTASGIVSQFAAERWVWGDDGVPAISASTIGAEVLEIYENDYIAAWDRVLRDIEPIRPASLVLAKESLAILGGPSSPLRGLLKTIDEHTFLVKPPETPKDEDRGLTDRLHDVFQRGKVAAGLAAIPPGTTVTTHFRAIHQLVSGEQGSAPIEVVLEKVRQLQQKLEPVGSGVGQIDPLEPSVVSGVSEVVKSLRREAAMLPPAVGGVVNAVASGAAAVARKDVRGTLDSRYRQMVQRECTDITTGRYPFAPGSTADVPLADFTRLFGYGGVFDTFFKEELEPLVDATRTPWMWRTDGSGAAVGPSLAMLRQFEAADHIKRTFFRPGAPGPELRTQITPIDLDATATRLVIELDGQRVEYRHGPERAASVVWPGPAPGVAAVSFEDRSAVRPNLAFEGAWAWFRLLQAASMARETDARYVAHFSLGGHNARLRLEASSIRNPYGASDLQRFHCGSMS